ncbi:MAG TPA: hypothetical protein DD632_02070 [Oribacterium sp.]|nr:hypothetical protein [Oribacterium sp.]
MRNSGFFRRLFKAGAAAVLTSALCASPVLAGEWRANSTGFWYVNDDGSYPTLSWQWIDSDGDGVYQCFAFDADGYLMLNQTTPDGYLVSGGGAWFDGVTPVTRTYPVGTYVPPTPIESLQKYGYAADGTKLVTSRTGAKANASTSGSKKTSSKSSSTKSSSSSSKKTGSSTGSSSATTKNAGNTASVAKKDLVSGKITVGKTDADASSTTNASSSGSTSTSGSSTTERTDPSTTAPSTSGFGPTVPKKSTSDSSTSGPQTVMSSSDGPNRGGSYTTESR